MEIFDNLFDGVNPFCIQYIGMKKFRRYGVHPYFETLFAKKYPFWYKSGAYPFSKYGSRSDGWSDGIMKPRVIFYNSQGLIMHEIECKSNDEAQALYHNYTLQLDQFIADVREHLKK